MDRDNKIPPHKSWRGSLLPKEPSSALPVRQARARTHQLQATGAQGTGEAEQLVQFLRPLAQRPDSEGFQHSQSQQHHPNTLAVASLQTFTAG